MTTVGFFCSVIFKIVVFPFLCPFHLKSNDPSCNINHYLPIITNYIEKPPSAARELVGQTSSEMKWKRLKYFPTSRRTVAQHRQPINSRDIKFSFNSLLKRLSRSPSSYQLFTHRASRKALRSRLAIESKSQNVFINRTIEMRISFYVAHSFFSHKPFPKWQAQSSCRKWLCHKKACLIKFLFC